MVEKVESNDILIIGKKEYKVRNEDLKQIQLKFYPENPRIYSLLYNANASQQDIEELMCNMDHVKQLKESIKANGGLIDPIIVRDGDYVVLEGNSRLAAYRLLCKTDSYKWGKVRCTILPADINDEAIFSLLGQYHIVGRKDWSPYEQAGYLCRMLESSKQPIEFLAKELGLTESKAKSLVDVYTCMRENNDMKTSQWSYYEELLKHRGNKKFIETVDGFEEKILGDIKIGKIKQAIDIRNVLGVITNTPGKESKKVIQDIVKGDYDIYEGYEIIKDTGKTDDVYKTLNGFRKKILDKDFKKKVQYGDSKEELKYELKQIKRTVDELLKIFDN